MLVLSHSKDIPLESIWVDRPNRQRKSIDINDLIHSVRMNGVMTPILVEQAEGPEGQPYKLVFGERRFATATFLKFAVIPARIADELSELERQIIELEENVRRKDLTWQENVLAMLRVHRIYLDKDPEWTEEQTSVALNYSPPHVRKCITVAEELEKKDADITKADSLVAAFTILTRRNERALGNAINQILEVEAPAGEAEEESDPEAATAFANALVQEQLDGTPVPPEVAAAAAPSIAPRLARPKLPEEKFSIVNTKLEDWLDSYTGPKFNFLHLDLPYGVPLNGQANQSAFGGGGYESNPDIYWYLLDQLLDNWTKFMLPSAQFMCWISMNFYEETRARFEAKVPHLTSISKTPLVWHKTDNKGILADPKRGPRNIYEACLFGSTKDRFVVKPVANVYGAPTGKADAIHTNEKPIPMLRHFFQLFVDNNTRVLDPTCGSGSAIRAAESMGAEFGIGLEMNPEFAARAADTLRRERNLRRLSDAAGSSPAKLDKEEEEA